MLARLKSILLWQYDAGTPVATLRRHHRIARRVVYVWTASCVVLISSFAELLFFNEASTTGVILVAAAGLLGISLALPAIAAAFWATEIEKVLAERGLASAPAQSVERRLGIAAMKMFFWAVVLVLIAHFCLP